MRLFNYVNSFDIMKSYTMLSSFKKSYLSSNVGRKNLKIIMDDAGSKKNIGL